MRAKHQAFVNEYLKDFNATQAAVRCGYSARTAKQIGSRLLTYVDIQEAIQEAVEMKPDEVKSRLADIARGNMADLMDITPSGFTLQLMVKDADGNLVVNPNTKLIKKIKQKATTFLSKTEDGEDREVIETEIELYSAHEALRDIGKVHKMFTDKTEVTGADGAPLVDVDGAIEKALKKVYGNGDQGNS